MRGTRAALGRKCPEFAARPRECPRRCRKARHRRCAIALARRRLAGRAHEPAAQVELALDPAQLPLRESRCASLSSARSTRRDEVGGGWSDHRRLACRCSRSMPPMCLSARMNSRASGARCHKRRIGIVGMPKARSEERGGKTGDDGVGHRLVPVRQYGTKHLFPAHCARDRAENRRHRKQRGERRSEAARAQRRKYGDRRSAGTRNGKARAANRRHAQMWASAVAWLDGSHLRPDPPAHGSGKIVATHGVAGAGVDWRHPGRTALAPARIATGVQERNQNCQRKGCRDCPPRPHRAQSATAAVSRASNATRHPRTGPDEASIAAARARSRQVRRRRQAPASISRPIPRVAALFMRSEATARLRHHLGHRVPASGPARDEAPLPACRGTAHVSDRTT